MKFYIKDTDLSKYDLNIICNESFLDIIEMDMLSFFAKNRLFDHNTISYFPNMNQKVDSYQVVLVVIVKMTYHQSSTMCQQSHVHFTSPTSNSHV